MLIIRWKLTTSWFEDSRQILVVWRNPRDAGFMSHAARELAGMLYLSRV
jgi:hypothetical protein